MLSFKVLGMPVSWKRVGQDKSGRRVNPKAMREDQKRVASIAEPLWIGRPPHFGPVKIFVQGVFAIPSSWSAAEKAAAMAGERYRDIDPDADRLLNQIMDALKFIAYVDDNQAVDVRCVMRYGLPERREVFVQELEGGNLDAMKRRKAKWFAGGYNQDIAKAPCGIARWPQTIRADAARLGLELVA
jgi:Holliday junction resolvase RusA-like endonuclease